MSSAISTIIRCGSTAAGESEIEGGKSGEAVGAVRNVLYQGKRIRQTLLALSDPERSQTYEFCGEAPMPVEHYRATLRVTPVVDGDRGFVEWWATFDCPPERHDEWTVFFRDGFARWLSSLRRHLDGRGRDLSGLCGGPAARRWPAFLHGPHARSAGWRLQLRMRSNAVEPIALPARAPAF